MMNKRFVLLDRDGTIIVERNYLSDPAGVELLPGATRGLKQLRAVGLGLVVITNQSGIGRGYFSSAEVEKVHGRMVHLLAQAGATLDAIYICPHAPEQGCSCRKPAPAMAVRAAEEWAFDLRESFVIGDKPCDIDLGRRVGAVTLLTRTGYGAQYAAAGLAADYTVSDLEEAASIITGLVSRAAD
jgi:histidinol-phosphate phosphatase family protein